MSFPLKVGAATLAISSIGGISSGLGAYFGTNRKEIKQGKSVADLINEQYDYILLKPEDNWEEVWAKYEKENTVKEKGKDAFQLTGWPAKDGNKLIEELKQKCNSLSKETGVTLKDKLYKNLINYCSRGVTFEEKVIWEGLEIANINGDEGIWDDRQKRSSGDLYEDLKKLGSAGVRIVVDRAGIKRGCENAKGKDKQARGNGVVYSSYKNVCTKGKQKK